MLDAETSEKAETPNRQQPGHGKSNSVKPHSSPFGLAVFRQPQPARESSYYRGSISETSDSVNGFACIFTKRNIWRVVLRYAQLAAGMRPRRAERLGYLGAVFSASAFSSA